MDNERHFSTMKSFFKRCADIAQSKIVPHIVKNRRILLSSSVAIFVVVSVFYAVAVKPPLDFPERTMIHIENGNTISEIVGELESKHVVKSALWLKIFSTIFSKEGGILAGDYFFESPRNAIYIARSITSGNFGLEPIEVTIPEGTTVSEMADLFSDKIHSFEADQFVKYASSDEGYLFPDTYLFLPNVDARDVVRTMRDTFDEKIESLSTEIAEFGLSLSDVVTMASIVEEEARQLRSRQIVAGILWKRISIGMPLQVDAAFSSVNGKNSFTLTREDLKKDHPYNTYTNTGLPPGPISNPGLDSIRATVTPIETSYLYFLTGRDGFMYYAETFNEHVRNKNLYLN